MQYQALRTIDLPRLDVFIESGSIFDETVLPADALDALLRRGKIAPADEADDEPEPEAEPVDDDESD